MKRKLFLFLTVVLLMLSLSFYSCAALKTTKRPLPPVITISTEITGYFIGMTDNGKNILEVLGISTKDKKELRFLTPKDYSIKNSYLAAQKMLENAKYIEITAHPLTTDLLRETILASSPEIIKFFKENPFEKHGTPHFLLKKLKIGNQIMKFE